MKIKSWKIDLVIIVTTIIIAISGIFYFGELITIKNSEEIHPFRNYITNSGIIKISSIQFCLAILMIVLLTNKILSKKKKINQLQIIGLLLISIGLGLIPCIEMWYGSTFYYGEVRDKQGLGFPFVSLIFMIYPFWVFKGKIIYLNLKQLSVRLIASVSLIVFSSIFYEQIYESWKIWQS